MTYHSNVLALVLAIATNLPLVVESSRVSSNLQFLLPQELSHEDGNYDHREALFGVPPYGKAIQANVYQDKENKDLCLGPLDPVKVFHGTPPYILMVDRGSCSFVQKVRNAQHSGATAVLIADNMCQCEHEESGICESSEGTLCEEREPMMADDGSGSDITIPAMLMFKQDADKIKEQLAQKTMVRAEMRWSVPNPDNHVEYDLWSTVTDKQSTVFQKMWLDAEKALGGTASFTPHYYIYDGLKAMCRDDESGLDTCFTLCTNEGRYCAIDPDSVLDEGISGADVVKESLRRLCIWDIYQADGSGSEFFQYVNEFDDYCDTDKEFMKISCVNHAMMRAEIDVERVNDCVEKSGGFETAGENTMLQDQLDAVEEFGIIVLPVAYVNGIPLRGTLDFDVVFKAICAGYADGTVPDICTKCADCSSGEMDSEYRCVVDDYCSIKDVGGVSLNIFGSTVVGMLFLFGIIAFVQQKRNQSQMRRQVKGIMAEYMPLDKQNLGTADTVSDDDGSGEFEIS